MRLPGASINDRSEASAGDRQSGKRFGACLNGVGLNWTKKNRRGVCRRRFFFAAHFAAALSAAVTRKRQSKS
jgi:hypothetical protein